MDVSFRGGGLSRTLPYEFVLFFFGTLSREGLCIFKLFFFAKLVVLVWTPEDAFPLYFPSVCVCRCTVRRLHFQLLFFLFFFMSVFSHSLSHPFNEGKSSWAAFLAPTQFFFTVKAFVEGRRKKKKKIAIYYR